MQGIYDDSIDHFESVTNVAKKDHKERMLEIFDEFIWSKYENEFWDWYSMRFSDSIEELAATKKSGALW